MSYNKKKPSYSEAPTTGLLSSAAQPPRHDLETGTGAAVGSSDDGKREQEVQEGIRLIVEKTSALNALVHRVRQGDEKVVHRLSQEIEAIKSSADRVERELLEIAPKPNPSDRPSIKDQKRMKYLKVKKNFEMAVKEFENLSREALSVIQALKKPKATPQDNLKKQSTDDELGDDVNNIDPVASDALVMAAADIQFNDQLLADREEDIQGIQRDIEGIKTLYKELAYHVTSQGEDLDVIEENMQNTVDRTDQAAEQIQISDTYQQRRTKRFICILLSCVVVIMIVVIVAMGTN